MSEPVAVPVEPQESNQPPRSAKRIGGVDGSIIEASSIDDYQATKGQPYVADYFGIDSRNEEFAGLISDVNEWISEVTDGSIGMAQQELETMFEVLNLKDTDSGFHNINKVREFIEVKRQQMQMESMMEQVERDITDGLSDDHHLKVEQQRINSLKSEINKRQAQIDKARKKALADSRKLR